MKIIKMKIVKVQRRNGSATITIPAKALEEIGPVEYMVCELWEKNGEKILVYRPVRI